MNNTARGLIFACGLAGMVGMFFIMFTAIEEAGSSGQTFELKDLANALGLGLAMIACAVVAGAALVGMTPPRPRAAYPYPQQYPQQGQPYPQQAAVPQQHAPQQQYGQQQAPQQPRQD
ncbi:hypothetical protein [Actinomadura sp. 3N508]|uniref:hypothetical protein n=1 Tax=Actinomadura sp. 3N508 TaxID=3375153 RepID=UPI0037987D64